MRRHALALLQQHSAQEEELLMTSKLRVLGILVLVLSTVTYAKSPDQPYMQSARADLLNAKRELQLATANKGGHRARAINLINSAVTEVNLGIQYDRRNNHATPVATASGPDQPHMQAALDLLKSAKQNLDNATADKGGHRKNAIEYVKSAIDEVKKGIDFAD
jgi:hypothetical protein